MTEFSERVALLKAQYDFKQSRLLERKREVDRFNDNYNLYLNRAKALSYITLLSDDSTKGIRDYLESVINRALDVVFGRNQYKFYLNSDLEAQKIELVLSEYSQGEWFDLDIRLQAGDGMGQVIGLLYSIVLAEITNHRMLFLEDEVLGGLHEDAVHFIKRCLTEFSKHGAQFALIEYTVENFGLQYDMVSIGDKTSKVASKTKFSPEGQELSHVEFS